MNKKFSNKSFVVTSFIVIIMLDQLSKFLARSFLFDNPIIIIKEVFHLSFVKNTGIAFGLFNNSNTILIFLSLMVIGLLMYFYDSFPKNKLTNLSLIFIFGGAVSNLFDRVFVGYITDFLDFRVWPVFNFADSFIFIGTAYLIYYFWTNKKN